MGRTGMKFKNILSFPVRRIQRYLKAHHLVNRKSRVSTTGALYLAAVLEYLVAEVCELAGDAARQNKKRRISPRFIWMAIKNDAELRQLLKGSIIPESGNLWGATIQCDNKCSAPAQISKRTKKQPMMAIAATATNHVGGDAQLGGSVETLGRKLISGLQLSVLKADITSVQADCYVNPTSSNVGFGGQVGARISTVGGDPLAQAMQPFSNQIIPSCGAVATPAVGLKAHHIIHCNSPSFNDGDSIQKLETTVKNCLDEVCRLKMKAVAFPSIGSGGNQFPKQIAAQTILKTISDYFKNKPKAHFDTEKIIFVLFDKQSVNIYRTELGRLIE